MTGIVKNFPGGPFFIPLATDGTDLYGITCDGDGHLEIDVVSLAGIADLATEATLEAVRDRIGALTAPAAGSVNKQLADLLTELQAKLETGDLSIEAVTKYLEVAVKSSTLPTDAATQTTLAGMQSQIGAIGGGDAGTALAYLLALQTRMGAVGGGDAGTALQYLKDALTALQVIDGFANADNVLFGFNAGLAERESTVSTGGANTNATMSGPDSGEIFVVQCVGVQHNDTVARKTMIYLSRSGETPLLAQVVAHDPGEFLQGTAPFVMINGDSLVGRVDALANAKTVSLDVIGYKMKV